MQINALIEVCYTWIGRFSTSNQSRHCADNMLRSTCDTAIIIASLNQTESIADMTA